MNVAEKTELLQKHLADLNGPQREAVEHFEGPILVLAGAGSGKTRVLTRRVANLIINHRVNPENILAVTFTNKATEEMRERLHELLGDRAHRLWVATFHSAGLRILRRHAQELSYNSDFAIYDDADTKAVLKQILKDCNIDDKKYPPSLFSHAIDSAKNSLITPEEYIAWMKDKGVVGSGRFAQEQHFIINQQGEVYDYYQQALRRANAMDFGDLIMNSVQILEKSKELQELYQRQIRFSLVDEFQDTNLAQYRLIQLLVGKAGNLLVVGDDDQSIYAFRGATIRNILEFEKNFPSAKIVTLDQNYRSTGNVLKAANAVIEHNSERREKRLWTAESDGEKLHMYVAGDETEEAQFIATKIKQFQEAQISLNEIALFYRTNAQSRALEEALVSKSIPYRIFGGLKFYERKEIKDILAYLRLIFSDTDDQAVLRTINTPPRGIGAQTIQALVQESQQTKIPLLKIVFSTVSKNKGIKKYVELIQSFRLRALKTQLSELIQALVEESGYGPKLRELGDPNSQARLENLLELQAIGRSMERADEEPRTTLQKLLDRIALTSGADIPSETNVTSDKDPKTSVPPVAVSLMTLHLAKGLEFPYVFLTGLEEGLLPHYRSLDSPAGLEEERRLCYVGITRAMKSLFLTRALSRGMFASGNSFGFGGGYRTRSRYIADIPPETIEFLEYVPQVEEETKEHVWDQDKFLRSGVDAEFDD